MAWTEGTRDDRMSVRCPLLQALCASWQVESNMQWQAYRGWVTTQLFEFRLGNSEADSLRLSRALEGDVYSVTLKRSPRQGDLLVEATFQALPF